MLHLLEGPVQRRITLLSIEEEKSPAPGRNWTHGLSVMRRALYRCVTTTVLVLLKPHRCQGMSFDEWFKSRFWATWKKSFFSQNHFLTDGVPRTSLSQLLKKKFGIFFLGRPSWVIKSWRQNGHCSYDVTVIFSSLWRHCDHCFCLASL